MSDTVHPNQGRYALVGGSSEQLKAEVSIGATTLKATFGELTWDDDEKWFRSEDPEVVIRFYGGPEEGTWSATWGAKSYSGSWHRI